MSVRTRNTIVGWALIVFVLLVRQAPAAEASLGGFIPFVGIGLTDEFKDSTTDLTGTFFMADASFSPGGNDLPSNGSPFYDLALLDTGAAAHILTYDAAGTSGFDIAGNGFEGENYQQIGGATGVVDLRINDPLGIYAAGLDDRTGDGATLTMNPGAMRGQTSVATLEAPVDWTLPNILGLPMAAQHAISIRNDQPQIFEYQGRTVRTPQIDFIDLGTGDQQNILRRTDLKLRPGSSFIAGPLYVQNFDLFELNFHDNPLSPTVVENGGLFVEVDLADGSDSLEDTEFLFDTGADMTVVSQVMAARLGFDPVLDAPDFVIEVEGSGGVSDGVPGFYLDELNIDTVGGSFTMQNVPIAVLDVANPNDPGNVIDGILGMHLFNGRNLVIDANPAVGQGGAGPSLYISDPVTQSHAWASTQATGQWDTTSHWSDPGTPGELWDAVVQNAVASNQKAQVTADSTVFHLDVRGNLGAEMEVAVDNGAVLTTFGETLIGNGGRIDVASGGKLDAQFVNIDGGTLAGSGEVFVGTGPVHGAVRNLAGRIEPGSPLGTLSVDGDMSNLNDGTLAIDLGGTTAGTDYDQLALSRYAFLGGTLEVSLLGFTPTVGQMFTILTAGEGVVGQFDATLFPAGYQWDIDYLGNSVVLEVTGVGSIPGDFNFDGYVDGADLALWRTGFTAGTYDGGDFLLWQRNYAPAGSAPLATGVPEPGTMGLALLAAAAMLRIRPRRASAR